MVQISIPLDDSDNRLHGELIIPKTVKGLIVFVHGRGSGRASPRNQRVANILNYNGFATFLVVLLTQGEQQSDLKSQKILEKYPTLMLNKFNIKLLARRLETATTWLIEIKADVKNLPIGYYGSSTGAAAAIEASILLDKVKVIVSRGVSFFSSMILIVLTFQNDKFDILWIVNSLVIISLSLLIPYMIWQKFLGKQQETDKLNDIMYDTIEIFELKKIQLEFKYRSV
ncbi:alpha/beta fold hydrolase [Candidatus Nitrosocosmicus sp. R]